MTADKCETTDGCGQGDSCHENGKRCGRCSAETLCQPQSSSGGGAGEVSVEGPVCASDGRTYAGQCAVKLTSCLRGAAISVLHEGPCDQISGSGGNDEPLTNGR